MGREGQAGADRSSGRGGEPLRLRPSEPARLHGRLRRPAPHPARRPRGDGRVRRRHRRPRRPLRPRPDSH
ncbi:MAG: hypothetical protein L0206_11390 [Actinobacteria bacterium]|nr:hypothetical protein [Actinomycetota bacterium]